MKPSWINRLIILSCFAIAIILRIAYLLTPPINSDRAIIGLIGRHILHGEFPVFFYGDYYEGVFEAYVAAPLFWLFGSSRYVLNSVPAIMSLILIYAVYKLAQTLYGNNASKLALLFSCIAPSYFVVMTTFPMNGYIETGILGAVAFILTYKIKYQASNLNILYFLLGLVLGFGFYLQFHIVPFALTTGLIIFINDKKIIFKKYLLLAMLGFLVGSSPLLISNIFNGFTTFSHIGKGIEHSTFLGTLKHLFGYGYLVILGVRPDQADTNFVPYLSYLILAVYVVSFIFLLVKRENGSELIITFLLIFPISLWLSGRGEVNTRRYLLPLYAVTPVVIAYFLSWLKEKSKFLFYGVIVLIAGSNLYTNVIAIPILNKELLAEHKAELKVDRDCYNFLRSQHIKGVYASSWWISFKMDFDFKENIIFTLIQDEPYAKYQKFVDKENNPAFLDYYSAFVPTFNSIGGTYSQETISPPRMGIQPYTVFYNFTPTAQELEEITSEGWSANACEKSENACLVFDRDIYTHWSSQTTQKKNMDFIIDLGKICTNVTRVCYSPAHKIDWPAGYILYGSLDGNKWISIAQNEAFLIPTFWDGPHPFMKTINGLIEIDFKPQSLRYLKLVLTQNKEHCFWSIAEFFVYRQIGIKTADWNIDSLIRRLRNINPQNIHADPWVTSHLNMEYQPDKEAKTVFDAYIYRRNLIKNGEFTGRVFVVLNENYPSFVKILDNIEYVVEDFGPYKLVVCRKNSIPPAHYYWDGFHLLKLWKY